MSVLTTAAIIGIAAAASAGGAVASAAIQAHAAGNAVDAQTAATNKALAVQQQAGAQQQANEAPYMALGSQALGKLSGYQAPTAGFNPSNYQNGALKPGAGAGLTPTWASPTPAAISQPQSLSSLGAMSQGQLRPGMAQPGAMAPSGMDQQSTGPQTPMGSNVAAGQAPATNGTVRIQAPTGEQRDVPLQDLQHYLQLGATRVY